MSDPLFHPVANLFPLLGEDDLRVLAEDIRANGLREPVWLHRDGRILDGRNRWRACREAGVLPLTRTFAGADDELVQFVVSLNLHRRHLDESQRALVAARLATMRQGARTDLTAIAAMSQPQAAGLLSVSVDSLQRAKQVLEHGTPELVAAVEQGCVAVSTAADLAVLPPDEQRKIVARGRDEILRVAKERRQGALPWTGEVEWYTPPDVVELVRQVLGRIDLDPASSDAAQEVVKARRYFTREQGGLSKPWGTLKRPSRVFLNPPYAAGVIDEFVSKLVEEHAAGRVSEAVLLTHARTDAPWFHEAALAAAAVCYARRRISFQRPDGTGGAPPIGSSLFYFGADPDGFAAIFSDVGLVYGRVLQAVRQPLLEAAA
jgi:ParB-like chromosome segregation protein Spo0J